MFYIDRGVLHIAPKKSPLSHSQWMRQQGLDDSAIKQLVRGFVDQNGDVHFYVGSDFDVDQNSEEQMKKHLPELLKQLNLNDNAQVFGGAVPQQNFDIWPARKQYGTIESILNK